MNSFLDWAQTLSPLEAILWLSVLNVATFGLTVAIGCALTYLFAERRIVANPDGLSRREVIYTVLGIAVNTLITVIGWYLWTKDILVIRRDTGWRAWLDFPILILAMDFGMYVLHRVAHFSWFYPIHRMHHEYERPWALTLFVLHPLETFGFGMLWLVVVIACQPSWLGLSLYMAANLGSGVLGHLGVEPFPRWWAHVPLLREVGTSTFHARHHQDIHHNFGFYTVVWDRLFGTLFPHYDESFGTMLDSRSSDAQARGTFSGS
jgi:Delta7-sterol 5-desaturase